MPVLAETFGRVASIRIRSVATLGGALAHADPNQDPPPSLMVLDARVCLRSSHGQREVGIAEFFVDYYETVLEPDEMVTAVIVPPLPANSGASFLKFLPQTQDDYATVAVAARLTLDADRIVQARVALGAAGATPLRASAVEAALQGQHRRRLSSVTPPHWWPRRSIRAMISAARPTTSGTWPWCSSSGRSTTRWGEPAPEEGRGEF